MRKYSGTPISGVGILNQTQHADFQKSGYQNSLDIKCPDIKSLSTTCFDIWTFLCPDIEFDLKSGLRMGESGFLMFQYPDLLKPEYTVRRLVQKLT